MRLFDSVDSSGCTTAGGTEYQLAINFNGSSVANTTTTYSVGDTVTLSGLNSYIGVVYSSAATTTPSATFDYSQTSNSTVSGTCSAGQIVVTDGNGKVLQIITACTGVTTSTSVTVSSTATVGSSGGIYMFYNRVGDSSGGMRIWGITYTY